MLSFAKYQACENDFIVVVDSPVSREQAVALCHRRRGVGADGVLCLSKGETGWQMRIINADGSEAEMCGNGFRCAVKHLVDRQLAQAPITIATAAGVLAATFTRDKLQKVDTVSVDMGPPRSAIEALELSVGARRFSGHTVSMGNPHYVIASAEPRADATAFGLALATHPHFARGCNIEFVAWHGEVAECVVHERGAGLTEACGTGGCAVALVGKSLGHDIKDVDLPGGRLHIEINHTVVMTGPVAWAFDGSA